MARDRVHPDLHRKIVQRDGCLMYRFDRYHECFDVNGIHGPWAVDRLTVEHVWGESEKLPGHSEAAKGMRALSTEYTLVGMCAGLNGSGMRTPPADFRAFAKEYLIGRRAYDEREAARARNR